MKKASQKHQKVFYLFALAILLAACGQQSNLPERVDLDSQAACNYIFVRGVYVIDDHEPWTSGDPEIMLLSKVRNSGAEKKIDYGWVNSENVWYSLNNYIGCADRDALFKWYERDGTSLNLTVSVKGVTFSTKIDNSDDDLGSALVTLGDMRPWPTEVNVGSAKFKVCSVPLLQKGMSGASVKHLQNRLLAFGGTPASYIRNSGGADGNFGTGTYNAVVAFQKIKFPNQPGEWDGKVGNQTWGALGC